MNARPNIKKQILLKDAAAYIDELQIRIAFAEKCLGNAWESSTGKSFGESVKNELAPYRVEYPIALIRELRDDD